MALILNIETATPLCSVALTLNGKVIAQRETLEEKSHASNLTVFIEEILYEQKIKLTDLDAVAIGKGPGSYTGLRIGVSTAKGVCYGAGIPLLAANTLQIMYKQVVDFYQQVLKNIPHNKAVLYCPMIDARRMEVFTCLFDGNGSEIEAVSAKVINESSFQYELNQNNIVFFGSGIEKCRDVLSHPDAYFIPDIHPHASSLGLLAEDIFNRRAMEDIAYFEPFYLKDFIATIPKKRFQV
jgi:tRNA threonylcarbamoyladenosine biosynthesis protein TsaB